MTAAPFAGSKAVEDDDDDLTDAALVQGLPHEVHDCPDENDDQCGPSEEELGALHLRKAA